MQGLVGWSVKILATPLVLLFVPWMAGWQVPQAGQNDAADAAKARIDTILTDLEKRSDGLRDIRCKVRFVEDDKINLTRRIKIGQILFLIIEPNPHFLIHFEKTEADGVAYKQEWYLFDGRWLHQGIERLKQVTKEEIVREGDKIDLFDLESAPFPLPFGQEKEKILVNFEVTLAAPTPADPPNTDHLICIPKPESRLARQYDKLEFFILRDVHLPGRIVVTKNDGLEVNTADFPDLTEKSINTGVGKKAFTHPKAWSKYELVVERLPPPEGSSPP